MNPYVSQRYQMPNISKILVVNRLAYLSLKSENDDSPYLYSSTFRILSNGDEIFKKYK